MGAERPITHLQTRGHLASWSTLDPATGTNPGGSPIVVRLELCKSGWIGRSESMLPALPDTCAAFPNLEWLAISLRMEVRIWVP